MTNRDETRVGGYDMNRDRRVTYVADKTCDICGYEGSESKVGLFRDGVFRCLVCASKAAHGRYIPAYEIVEMTRGQLAELNRQWETWINSLTEGIDNE